MSQSFHAGTFTKPQGAEGFVCVFFWLSTWSPLGATCVSWSPLSSAPPWALLCTFSSHVCPLLIFAIPRVWIPNSLLTPCMKGEPSLLRAFWLNYLLPIYWEELRSSCSRWWPMATTWASANPCTTRPSWQASLCSAGGAGLAGRLLAFPGSAPAGLAVALLWA